MVEIDPAVVRVAQQYFGFQAGAHEHVNDRTAGLTCGGCCAARSATSSSCWMPTSSQYIPEHMLTREFLSEVRSLLAPDGIVAANTFSSSRLYQNESVTYRAVFGPFYNFKSGNRVILASNGPLPSIARRSRNSRTVHAAFRPTG